MENENEQIQATETKEDAIMPVGWDGETDFFEWASNEKADELVDETTDSTEESSTGESEETPATGTETEENVESETEESEETPATGTEDEAQSTKIKFEANINHKVQSIELEKSQLPELYEKAYAADKFRNKLNAKTKELEEAEVVSKILGYENIKDMLAAARKSFEETEVERLTNEKVHPDIAKDTVSRRIKEIEESVAKNRKATPEVEQQPQGQPQRNFEAEAFDLLQVYPEMKGQKLPEEVVDAVKRGETILVAYTKYKQKQDKADKARLKKENKTLKQNAEAAKRAPVRGVAKGGATNVGADDPFIKGFSSYGSYN